MESIWAVTGHVAILHFYMAIYKYWASFINLLVMCVNDFAKLKKISARFTEVSVMLIFFVLVCIDNLWLICIFIKHIHGFSDTHKI